MANEGELLDANGYVSERLQECDSQRRASFRSTSDQVNPEWASWRYQAVRGRRRFQRWPRGRSAAVPLTRFLDVRDASGPSGEDVPETPSRGISAAWGAGSVTTACSSGALQTITDSEAAACPAGGSSTQTFPVERSGRTRGGGGRGAGSRTGI